MIQIYINDHRRKAKHLFKLLPGENGCFGGPATTSRLVGTPSCSVVRGCPSAGKPLRSAPRPTEEEECVQGTLRKLYGISKLYSMPMNIELLDAFEFVFLLPDHMLSIKPASKSGISHSGSCDLVEPGCGTGRHILG